MSSIQAANRRGSRRRPLERPRRSPARPARAHRRSYTLHGRGVAPDCRRCPTRSAKSARCECGLPVCRSVKMRVPLGSDRHHLRIASQRDRRRGGAVPEVRQRGNPPRGIRSAGIESRHCRVHSRRDLRRRDSPRDAVQVVRDARSRRGRAARHHGRRTSTSSSRAAAGGLIERLSPRGPDPGHQAPGRQLPRVHRRPCADPDMAVTVAFNAKTYRYGICGAMETLLVGRGIAPRVLPDPGRAVCGRGGGAPRLRRNARAGRRTRPRPREEDWETEYLAAILAVRVVGGR